MTNKQAYADRRVAFVSGGANGIGRAVCTRLASDGMAVGIADLDYEGACDLAAEIRGNGGEACSLRIDVTDEASVDDAFDELLATYGHLNYVAANAGIFIYGDLMDFTYEDFSKVMDVNLDGVALVCSRAAARMKEQGDAFGPRSIVITTSEGSFTQDPPSGVYIASKWGSRGFMRSLALELAPSGITVNAVGPGSVYTHLHQYVNERFAEMNNVSLEEATNLFAKVRPIRGYQPAEEVAAVFSFLFSDAARSVTGISFLDNGGHVMA
jgi:NAD(P)-dependent dehydrogenase (short-subunit alcohol dehydrogenase family)